LPFTVPLDSNTTTDNNNHHHHHHQNNNNNTSQSTVTQGEHHLVGHLRLNLPVLCVQKEYNQAILTHLPSLPVASPPLLSSHSTSSPPFFRNHANGAATFQWKTLNSDPAYPNLEISMHSVSLVDPASYLSTACSSTATDSSLEVGLFEHYFKKIHPTFPVLPHPLSLKLRSSALGDAIKAVALLPSAHALAQEYSTKAWEGMQSRGIDDLVTAQTLLVLSKYYETIGEEASSRRSVLLASAQAILATLPQDDEWVCRLQWIIYLNQGAWRDPPLIRLPCVLRCEQDDQAKAIALLLENIHIACVYTSAMQSLAGDPWAAHGQQLKDAGDTSI
jgi:hypothetical protein